MKVIDFPQSDGTKVPEKVRSVDELCGVLKMMNVGEIVCVIQDKNTGVWVITLNPENDEGVTAERINWLLDRAKLMVHEA